MDAMKLLTRIAQIEALPGYRLRLRYVDGATGVVDMAGTMAKGRVRGAGGRTVRHRPVDARRPRGVLAERWRQQGALRRRRLANAVAGGPGGGETPRPPAMDYQRSHRSGRSSVPHPAATGIKGGAAGSSDTSRACPRHREAYDEQGCCNRYHIPTHTPQPGRRRC